MSPDVKKVICQMTDIDVSNILPFGVQHSEILFPIGKRAIVEWQGHYYLVLPSNSSFNEEYKVLTELFSYLRYMENEHIVYVHPIDSKISVLLNNVSDQKRKSVKEEYDLGNNCTLCIVKDIPTIVSSELDVKMENVHDITALSREIEHYLHSYIYPTTSLKGFIKHDYLSESDYQTKRSVSISRKSIIVAILIAVCSPIATLFISNMWGYVTITESQFDIIKNLKSDTVQQKKGTITI